MLSHPKSVVDVSNELLRVCTSSIGFCNLYVNGKAILFGKQQVFHYIKNEVDVPFRLGQETFIRRISFCIYVSHLFSETKRKRRINREMVITRRGTKESILLHRHSKEHLDYKLNE